MQLSRSHELVGRMLILAHTFLRPSGLLFLAVSVWTHSDCVAQLVNSSPRHVSTTRATCRLIVLSCSCARLGLQRWIKSGDKAERWRIGCTKRQSQTGDRRRMIFERKRCAARDKGIISVSFWVNEPRVTGCNLDFVGPSFSFFLLSFSSSRSSLSSSPTL